MEIEAWKLILGAFGSVLTAIVGAWGIARVEKNKLVGEFQAWQAEAVKQERAWRIEAENERLKDGKDCDHRIEELRVKYDALRDKYDVLAEKHSEHRVQMHDLRGELGAFRQSLKTGGRRYLDPKQ